MQAACSLLARQGSAIDAGLDTSPARVDRDSRRGQRLSGHRRMRYVGCCTITCSPRRARSAADSRVGKRLYASIPAALHLSLASSRLSRDSCGLSLRVGQAHTVARHQQRLRRSAVGGHHRRAAAEPAEAATDAGAGAEAGALGRLADKQGGTTGGATDEKAGGGWGGEGGFGAKGGGTWLTRRWPTVLGQPSVKVCACACVRLCVWHLAVGSHLSPLTEGRATRALDQVTRDDARITSRVRTFSLPWVTGSRTGDARGDSPGRAWCRAWSMSRITSARRR